MKNQRFVSYHLTYKQTDTQKDITHLDTGMLLQRRLLEFFSVYFLTIMILYNSKIFFLCQVIK